MSEHAGLKRAETFLYVLLAFLTFYPLIGTGFTTSDDIRSALYAGRSLGDIWTLAWEQAVLQGRFFNWMIYLLAMVPYAVDHPLWYHAFLLGPILLNFWLFGRLARLFSGSAAIGAAVILVLLFGLQNTWERNLLNGSPFNLPFAFNLTLLGLLFLRRFFDSAAKRDLWLSAAFFLASTPWYEVFSVYLILFAYLYYVNRGRNGLLATLKPHWIAAGIYGVTYLSFRAIYGSVYEGTQLGGFSWLGFFKVIYQYSVSAIPGYVFFDPAYTRLAHEYGDSITGHAGLASAFAQTRPEWLARSLIVGFLSWSLLARKHSLDKSRWLAMMGGAALLYFLSPLPVALSPKYQEWMSGDSIGYAVTYFSFFGVALAIAATALFLNGKAVKRPAVFRTWVVAASVAAALVSYLTDFSTWHVSKSQAQSQLRWQAVEALLATDVMREIPEKSVIYAPSLWRNVFHAKTVPNYWTEYFEQKTGKQLLVVPDADTFVGVIDNVKDVAGIFYLKLAREDKDPNLFLVFSKASRVVRREGGGPVLESDKADLFSFSKNRRFTIHGATTAAPREICIDAASVSFDKDGHFVQPVDRISDRPDPLLRMTVRSNGAPLDLDSIQLSYFFPFPAPAAPKPCGLNPSIERR